VDLDPRVRGSASVVVSDLDYVCIFQIEEVEGKESTLIHISCGIRAF
jgi:hypothetical protein